ncbi:MAG TPA: DNA mismatch repair endonuclease MutL [Longimicrobium sp.]
MPRRIHILPEKLANQIAAGEVVERPASVVKELVENALDAGAARVDVTVRNGGKTEIRVADDGWGMGREDALLAVDRHATSKVRNEADLAAIRTLGFRGEALPSIGSVARLVLETAERDGDGTRVVVTAGQLAAVEECARRTGTTISVRSLFFNVPARAKFLRSSAAENRAVGEVVTTLALATPGIAYTLDTGGRDVLVLPAATTVAERVAAIWGPDAADELIPVAHRSGGIVLSGLIQRPDDSRPSTRRAYLFVNGRSFADRALVRAADRAFRTTIPQGVYPSLFLFLEVPDGEVDVNVHPAKAEVRFRDRAAVERVLEEGIRAALAGVDSTPSIGARAAPADARYEVAPGTGVAAVREAPPQPSGPPPPAEPQMTLFVTGASQGKQEPGQPDALRELLGSRDMNSQRLLFPLTLRLSPAEYALVEQITGLLEGAGYEIEPFGGRSIIVHSVPAPHPYFDAERCLREMITELTEGSSLVDSARTQHQRIALSMACKGAIKAGQKLTAREMSELFDRLFATELPYHDIHGRPTVVQLSLTELHRRFGRGG